MDIHVVVEGGMWKRSVFVVGTFIHFLSVVGGATKEAFPARRNRQNDQNSNGVNGVGDGEATYWCYACASPKKNEKREMVDAMEQLLKLRKTRYPDEYVHPDCHNPHDTSTLTKETCRYPWCYSITFDDGQGLPLSIRGCAEKYRAVNTAVVREECEDIHSQLSIVDCTCRSSLGMCVGGSAPLSQGNSRTTLLMSLLCSLLIFFSTY